MNFWGFTPAIFEQPEAHFEAFLQANAQEPKSEYYLPSLIDSLIKRVRSSALSYRQRALGLRDLPRRQSAGHRMYSEATDAGVYRPRAFTRFDR